MLLQPHEVEDAAIPRSCTAPVARSEGSASITVRRHKERPARDDYPQGNGLAGPAARFDKRLAALEAVNPPGGDLEVAYLVGLHRERRLARTGRRAPDAYDAFKRVTRHYANLAVNYVDEKAPEKLRAAALETLRLITAAYDFLQSLGADKGGGVS